MPLLTLALITLERGATLPEMVDRAARSSLGGGIITVSSSPSQTELGALHDISRRTRSLTTVLVAWEDDGLVPPGRAVTVGAFDDFATCWNRTMAGPHVPARAG